MVLWLLNGREGWSLSQSACRQCNGKDRARFAHKPQLFSVSSVICSLFAEKKSPTSEKDVFFLFKDHYKVGVGGLGGVAVLVLLQRAAGSDRETTFPSHAAY